MKAQDGSKPFRHFVLTMTGEPINLPDYSARLAAKGSVHVILFNDYQATTGGRPNEVGYIDKESKFFDFTPEHRHGLKRVHYVMYA